MKNIKSIIDVVEYQLCTGCGLCAFVESNRFEMRDTLKYGRRPFLVENPVNESGEAIAVCPGVNLSRSKDTSGEIIDDMYSGWGNIYKVREGYASDNLIRVKGSSGGLTTVLAQYCLDKEYVNEVIHTAAKEDNPVFNKTVISNCKEDLLRAAGSRYSPASPLEGLSYTRNNEKKYLVIGKPCDIAGVNNYSQRYPEFNKKVVLKIAFFCAGTPSLYGNIKFLNSKGIDDISKIKSLHYRGDGWPGNWRVSYKESNQSDKTVIDTYASSWGFLQKYRQWRCYICPDHSGEFADIAFGDPWYKNIKDDPKGKSLIITRTKKGEELIQAAIKDGYIVIDNEDYTLLPRSQKNLLSTNGAVWGRLFALKMFLLPSPYYKGFDLFNLWLNQLSMKAKLQSIYGTFKRIIVKRLYKKLNLKNSIFDD